jgi:DNA excision repair protein ERCC-2
MCHNENKCLLMGECMEGLKRVSVRDLVEFSIHGEDILPASGKLDMQAGMKGHKARQGQLGEGWQAEVPVNLNITAEGIDFLISGRMDVYFDADTPIIEELKLSSGIQPPEAAWPAHRSQAVVYGHLVCLEKGKNAVCLRVVYVTDEGKVRAFFEEKLTANELAQEFHALINAYAKWEAIQRSHRARRDESLMALAFPFDYYRPGQREMAVQVFTAIKQKRRLFASMPTGTGKSAAVLFPALKALGQGFTGQIFYLTARTTARQAALQAIDLMRKKGMHVRSLTLNAKEKQCPRFTRCHPDYCERAKGHFLRLPDALSEMLEKTDWNGQAVIDMADKYLLCPFEFALSLTEIADVVICDYNYAFDPAARIKRIFEWRTDLTLLADESHNLASRTRDMLSGLADGAYYRAYRTMLGKSNGRKGSLYKALTEALNQLRSIPFEEDAEEKEIDSLPDRLVPAMQALLEQVMEAFGNPPSGEAGQDLGEVYQMVIGFCAAADRGLLNYALLCRKQGKERAVRLLCLSVAEHLAEATKKLSGIVCFSATLSPLSAMQKLLGGGEEDACFAMPSPFPVENLLVLRYRVDTRYALRKETGFAVAAAILQAFTAKPGKYIAFFPSYAYLKLVGAELLMADTALPLLVQENGMEEADREAFLAQFTADDRPLLGLAVLGGVFAEGIDLPGERLLGVMVVGVGLPMVCPEQEALRRHYEKTLGDGFAYAYRYPGMHKVLQAAGRVIRSETDRGVVLLIDQRYYQNDYLSLCPPHWRFEGDTLENFWNRGQ